MIRFKKPPVVGAGISFDFDPKENKVKWDLELLQSYVRRHESELPKIQTVQQKQIQVDDTLSSELPKVIKHEVQLQFVRLWNQPQSRVLQLGDDHLSFHLLKSEEVRPGYSQVRTEVQPKLEDYIRTFEPTGVRSATIHYLDIIEIPRAEDREIILTDYFIPAFDVPDSPFGTMIAFSFQSIMDCPVDKGPLSLQLQAIPTPPTSAVFRFRMEWHKECVEVKTLDLTQMWARMDIAHKYIRDCFLAACTTRTLELFEPFEED